MNRKIKKAIGSLARTDLTLVVTVAFLLFFGAIMIYSASSYESMVKFKGNYSYYFDKQMTSLMIAVAFMILAYAVTNKIWVMGAYVSFGASVLLVLAARFSSVSYEANGAHRWINVGGFSLQPAEIAKLSAILLTAVFIRKRLEKDPGGLETIKGMAAVLWPAAVMAAELLLVTNNFSSALIVGLIAFLMVFVASRNYSRYVLVAVLGIAMAVLVVVLVKTNVIGGGSNFRFSRILAWLAPEADARGYGFQTLQSLYSIGSGGLMGKGLGQSVQKLGIIPEAQNDMIFSILCEELGIVGAVVVLLMYMLLIWRCMLVAKSAPSLVDSLVAVGVMSHIALQVIINVAVVTNTIPNTGVTLPFISYGGSSVVFTLMEIGLVLNISRRIGDEQHV